MLKKVVSAGLLGGLALIVWTFVVNGILGFQANAVGLSLAVFADLTNFGIGSYPAKDAIILAINHIMVWTLVGLVVAWRIRAERTDATNA